MKNESNVIITSNNSINKMISTDENAIPHLLKPKDWEELSCMTFGWSGSDIETLCRHAAMIPLRETFPMTSYLLGKNVTLTHRMMATEKITDKLTNSAVRSKYNEDNIHISMSNDDYSSYDLTKCLKDNIIKLRPILRSDFGKLLFHCKVIIKV